MAKPGSTSRTRLSGTFNTSVSLSVEADNHSDKIYFNGNTGNYGASVPKKDLVKALLKAGLTLEEFKAGIPTLRDSLETLPIDTVFKLTNNSTKFVKQSAHEFRNLVDGTIYVPGSFLFYHHTPEDLVILSTPVKND